MMFVTFKRRTSATLLAWVLTCLAPLGMAGDFYSALVPAPGGDEEAQRQRALGAALQVVVRQVTGDAKAAADPVLQKEYDTAASYAKSYSFEESPAGTKLVAQFDPGAVNAMLQRYGLSPRPDRPSVLVWVAGAGEDGDRMYLPDSDAGVYQMLDAAAARGGIGTLQPLMDLEDQTRLPPADISARVGPNVREASLRYSPDAAVTAYLMGNGEIWQADWLLVSGNTVRRWSTRGADLEGVLGAGMTDVAGILATLFPVSHRRPLDLSLPRTGSTTPVAPPATSGQPGVARPPRAAVPVSAPEGQILVRVAGISGAADYGRVMTLFRNNDAVSAHRVIASEPDALVLSVAPASDGKSVADALAKEEMLDAEPSGASAGSPGITYYFRLRP